MIRTEIDNIFLEILNNEGGFVNNANDSGGATKHGISLRYAKGIGLDLNQDGDIDIDDIRLVTPEQALKLYQDDFYTQPRIHILPLPIQPVITDMAVNAGPPRAIMILQKLLAMTEWPVAVDGRIGVKTRLATESAYEDMQGYLINSYVELRQQFYQELAEYRPANQIFLQGWMSRAESFRVSI